MEFSYSGTVGGYVSLARIELVSTNDLAPIQKLAKDLVFTFDNETGGREMELLHGELSMATANQGVPAWVDLTNSQTIYTYKDSQVTTKHRQHRRFLVREGNPVLYLILSGD